MAAIIGRVAQPRRILGCIALSIGALVLPGNVAGQAGAPELCLEHTKRTERRAALPKGLLRAIALTESGRWLPDRGERRPWPWAIRAGRTSWFPSSQEAALETLRALRTEGVTNIDVGCMQINLHYHGDAFASLKEVLDPASNVAYAAALLRDLWEKTGSWRLATGHYHSRHPARSAAYLARVQQFWQIGRARAPTGGRRQSITRESVREVRALAAEMRQALARLRSALMQAPSRRRIAFAR